MTNFAPGQGLFDVLTASLNGIVYLFGGHTKRNILDPDNVYNKTVWYTTGGSNWSILSAATNMPEGVAWSCASTNDTVYILGRGNLTTITRDDPFPSYLYKTTDLISWELLTNNFPDCTGVDTAADGTISYRPTDVKLFSLNGKIRALGWYSGYVNRTVSKYVGFGGIPRCLVTISIQNGNPYSYTDSLYSYLKYGFENQNFLTILKNECITHTNLNLHYYMQGLSATLSNWFETGMTAGIDYTDEEVTEELIKQWTFDRKTPSVLYPYVPPSGSYGGQTEQQWQESFLNNAIPSSVPPIGSISVSTTNGEDRPCNPISLKQYSTPACLGGSNSLPSPEITDKTTFVASLRDTDPVGFIRNLTYCGGLSAFLGNRHLVDALLSLVTYKLLPDGDVFAPGYEPQLDYGVNFGDFGYARTIRYWDNGEIITANSGVGFSSSPLITATEKSSCSSSEYGSKIGYFNSDVGLIASGGTFVGEIEQLDFWTEVQQNDPSFYTYCIEEGKTSVGIAISITGGTISGETTIDAGFDEGGYGAGTLEVHTGRTGADVTHPVNLSGGTFSGTIINNYFGVTNSGTPGHWHTVATNATLSPYLDGSETKYNVSFSQYMQGEGGGGIEPTEPIIIVPQAEIPGGYASKIPVLNNTVTGRSRYLDPTYRGIKMYDTYLEENSTSYGVPSDFVDVADAVTNMYVSYMGENYPATLPDLTITDSTDVTGYTLNYSGARDSGTFQNFPFGIPLEYNDNILLIGSQSTPSPVYTLIDYVYSSAVYKIDLTSQTVVQIGTLPTAVCNPAVVKFGDTIYCCFGKTEFGYNDAIFQSTDGGETWATIAAFSGKGMESPSAVVRNTDGRLFIFGGFRGEE
jgi:hypothetical protein